MRLKYRYLDLRRTVLQKNLLIRHRMLSIVRNHLDQNHFVEVRNADPLQVHARRRARLHRSKPLESRDSSTRFRNRPRRLKQLLMISGMDRYYQIARCFRDEDLRADRQPEFSQIDIEQSFLDEEAFFPILESMISKLWKEILGVDVPTPFPRMPY